MTQDEIRALLDDVDRHQAEDAAQMRQRLRSIEEKQQKLSEEFAQAAREQEAEQRDFVKKRLADLDEADREWDLDWLREHFQPDPGVAERTAAWVREEFPRVAAEAAAEASAWAHAAREEAERLGAKGAEALRVAREKAREAAAERRAASLKSFQETARREAERARRAEALSEELEREAVRLRDQLAQTTAKAEQERANRTRLEEQLLLAQAAQKAQRVQVARLRAEAEQRRHTLDRRRAAVLHSLNKVSQETARAEASHAETKKLKAQIRTSVARLRWRSKKPRPTQPPSQKRSARSLTSRIAPT